VKNIVQSPGLPHDPEPQRLILNVFAGLTDVAPPHPGRAYAPGREVTA